MWSALCRSHRPIEGLPRPYQQENPNPHSGLSVSFSICARAWTAMAKNRNKNKKRGALSMDICQETQLDVPQPMDMSEVKVANPTLGTVSRKIKKGVTIRRAKNLRKQKAVERAMSNTEKFEEKVSKSKDKMSRVQFAKTLYD
ncbi:hypothetical protein Taro_034670 [Colocasia esculenta]|uniref:Uncharacterized protein n=1 Tax=Colocasia esculenta TaxID=4460 RepID=A0A843WG66_COLES|nr:hypothetical protein [Colocasia esculenta]